MTGPSTSGAPDDLNFDRAEARAGAEGAAPNQCANCGQPLGESYYTANGAPICAPCRGRLEGAIAPVRSPAVLAKAIAFGFVAAVVGAIIYYAVMRYLNLEIGLVAILTGWMVGKAMSAATAGRGGRFLQVSAGALTYISVAMAYLFFVLQQPAPATQSAVGLAVYALVLPIALIFASMPSGLISAAIIGFGMVQAWQLTGAPKLVFEGPFKLAAGVGGAAPAPN